MRSIGLDVGDKRIGVALSDPQGILASPLATIERQDEIADVVTITDMASESGAGIIIVGLPRSMDGSIGQQAEKVKAFVHELRRHTGLSVEYRDERLSTVSALRLTQGFKKHREKAKVDAMAAAIILQSYLDEDVNLHHPNSGISKH